MKTVLFALNSSYSHSNIAIRYLASKLSENSIEPIIIEYTLKDKRGIVLNKLFSAEADIYAFSVYIWNRCEMLHFARQLKSIKPGCKIILGGPEVGFEDERFFEFHPYIDCIISGEGEDYICDICENTEKYYHKIVMCNPARDFEKSGVLYDKYPSTSPIIYYESSRGCPHKCSYCLSSATKGIRLKTAEKTINDLKAIEGLKNAKTVKFVDRTFNCNLPRAKAIWRELSKPEYSKTYHFEICADTIDCECIEIFSNLPKGRIQFEAGIQSTNEKTLKSINRYTNTGKVLDNLRKIKDLKNVHIHADLIVGLPFEDYNTFKKSFDETIGCCDKLQVGFLKLLKGSLLYSQIKEHGYVFDNEPPYQILCNKYIDYKEIFKLTQIADVIDRFYSSDKFENSMKYIVEHSNSAFDFFEKFTEHLNQNPSKMSQYECICALFEFCREYFDDTVVLEYIALDTLINENKNPPAIMNGYYSAHNAINQTLYSLPSVKDKYYIIDRTKHTYSLTEKIPD